MSVLPVGFGASGGYEIPYSLRFRASNSAYLSRTFGTPTDNNKWTWSGWLKRGLLSSVGLFGAGTSGSETEVFFESTGELVFYQILSSVNKGQGTTSAKYRDPSAHYHVVVVFDDANGTVADRLIIYVNGVSQSISMSTAIVAGNSFVNKASTSHTIGDGVLTSYFDGYLSEINFIDGQALTPSDFGETNADGVWVPKKYTGTYGNNGFYLDFKDGTSATTLGYDAAGSNDWTASGISTTAGVTYDWMTDTPTNNFATLNPIQYQRVSATYSTANLKWSRTSAINAVASSTTAVSTGKWYAEFVCENTDASQRCGIATVESTVFGTSEVPFGGVSTSYAYQADGTKDNNSSAAYGSTYTTNDVVSIALDLDSNKIWWAKNGTWQASGDPSAGTNSAFTVTSGTYLFGCSGEMAAAFTVNFGQRPFAYTPPTGFKSICTANLPAGGSITTSGSFTGNAAADGPFVWLNGNPLTMTINGNAVTFGTHADKTAGGFKLRTSSSSYNTAGSNTYSVSVTGELFGDIAHSPNNAQGNP